MTKRVKKKITAALGAIRLLEENKDEMLLMIKSDSEETLENYQKRVGEPPTNFRPSDEFRRLATTLVKIYSSDYEKSNNTYYAMKSALTSLEMDVPISSSVREWLKKGFSDWFLPENQTDLEQILELRPPKEGGGQSPRTQYIAAQKRSSAAMMIVKLMNQGETRKGAIEKTETQLPAGEEYTYDTLEKIYQEYGRACKVMLLLSEEIQNRKSRR